MAEKCSLCGNKIEEIFLGKIKGTMVGKKFVCSDCQKKHGNDLKKEIGG